MDIKGEAKVIRKVQTDEVAAIANADAKLRYNPSLGKWQCTDNGIVWYNLGEVEKGKA